MKHIAMAAAAFAAAATTLLTAPSALAADHGDTAWRPGAHPAASSTASGVKVSPATSYNNACGSGYSVIDSAPLSTLGTVYLTYNASTGYNCVVTVRANPGTAMEMVAAIRLTGASTWIIDEGNYTTYAGPVYLYAADKCIDWGGQIGSTYVQKFDSHCG